MATTMNAFMIDVMYIFLMIVSSGVVFLSHYFCTLEKPTIVVITLLTIIIPGIAFYAGMGPIGLSLVPIGPIVGYGVAWQMKKIDMRLMRGLIETAEQSTNEKD